MDRLVRAMGAMVAVLGRLVGKQAGQLRDKLQDILQGGPRGHTACRFL